MKLSIIGLVCLGLLAAFSAALLMAFMGGDFRVQTVQRAPAEVDVLVITDDLPSVSIVTEGLIERQTVAADEAPEGYLSNPLQVVGKALTRPVTKGQALTRDCFASNRRGQELIATLPAGRRAVTVDLTLAAGLEGLLYPGSIVDVLASFELKQGTNPGTALSTTLVQGVEVLAIDDDTVISTDANQTAAEEDDKRLLKPKSRRVTLGVNPKQATALQLATEHGTVSLAMRNPLDKDNPEQEPTLLSGGKLAGLAEYLEASVKDGPDAGEPVEAAETAEPPAEPVVERSAERRWDVTVMRGNAIEVRTLTRSPDTPATALLSATTTPPAP